MMKLTLFIFLISFQSLFASSFNLAQVRVECAPSLECSQRSARLESLVGEYRSLVHLKDTIKIMASDGGYEEFSYNIFKQDESHQLEIFISLKPLIKEIKISFTGNELERGLSGLFSSKEGDYFEEQKLEQDLQALPSRLDNLGFPDSSHKIQTHKFKDEVVIDLNIKLGRPRLFKGIRTNSKSVYINEFLKSKFSTFYNKPFELTRFKLFLDEAQKELFNYGHYLINLDFSPVIKKDRVTLDVKITNDMVFAFDIKPLIHEDREVIHRLLKDLFRKYKRTLSNTVIQTALQDHYRLRGLLKTTIRIETLNYDNNYKDPVTLYRIYINENNKTLLRDIRFAGNLFFSEGELLKLFQKEAFELARLGFYDEEFLNYFQDFLRSKYFEKGFVQARISAPNKFFSSDLSRANVEYVIQEGQRSFIRSISFKGIPQEMENQLLTKMKLQAGGAFNPLAMTDDLKTVTDLIQEQGHYFAEITNANEDGLVSYSKTGAEVDIQFNINPGPLVRLNRIIYLGNNKTRRKVIDKKLPLGPGDFITPSKTKEFEANLSATGLFNSVSVRPLKHYSSTSSSTDLVVKVVERDYGLLEIAPGYRTDLGLKLTATASYINIGGMNRAITLRSQINQRLDHLTFDKRRKQEKRHFLEHNSSLTYTQADIFNSRVDFSTAMSYQFRRFYSFDAQILRWSNTFTRDLSSHLSTSVRYQLEKITQTDATEQRENGSFQIGAITPSMSYDLRNSQINPTDGAFFNLSCEFANPYFLSQQQPDLLINYYKLVSRNRIYIPHRFGTVAISMVAGLQENLARERTIIDGVEQTEGYIPSIKVFRLTGMDIVRGFSDEEINQLPGNNSGTLENDISRVRVDDKAYLVNFKLEPRYFINDSLMLGAFYDAGRVFVNTPSFGELRDSVGITFKILTPVGSLDFDYGIKLDRQKVGPPGQRRLEDPGRFHVSIGFF
jgi:outer membrane protein insertion porin family